VGQQLKNPARIADYFSWPKRNGLPATADAAGSEILRKINQFPFHSNKSLSIG
jgi:hypothetical protein